ncbi:MAG: ATP-binding protein [Sterolibacterium sp.]
MHGDEPFLSTTSPEPSDRRAANVVFIASLVVFVAVAPFASRPLPQVPAFLPIYQSAFVIVELITAVLLFGQYNMRQSRALLVLGSGYLFSAAMAISHALSFPGLFAPNGLFGAGSEGTAWIFFLWHGGFPLFFIGYALLKDGGNESIRSRHDVLSAALLHVMAALVLACALTLLATAGQNVLPSIMAGDLDTPAKIIVATAVWMLSLVALAILWWRRPHSVIDLWLMVVMCVWIFESALDAVLNHGRYDLGWYAGRIYGVLAGSAVLMLLLLENGKLYGRLATAHASERKERQRAEEKTASLTIVNRNLDASIEALRDGSTRIQSILDTVADGIITIDEDGRIESFNPAAERLFGYSAGEAIGEKVSILMPEPYRSEHHGYIANYLSTGKERVIGRGREVVGRRKNGSTFPMSLAVSEMWLTGRRHFNGIASDITQRKEAEQSLILAKDQAELANRTKDSFLATMSHEIRTPLTGLLGMLELLSMSDLEGDQRETLNTAWASARGLLRIVNDILDWSKIQEGKLEMSPQATSIPQLLQDVVNTYSRVASAKSLVLWQHADSRLGPAHIADPLRLSQVLNNFVSNAIKFTHRGEVEVRADLVDRLNGGERVRFSVKDTGVGITVEDQQHLFQRYRQGGADTARMYGGTGLGLAICRSLADLMNGKIEIASEPGQGTTFSITLTFLVADAPDATVPSAHPELEHRRVTPLFQGGADAPIALAVDDHPINRNLLARQLALLGLRVETADDGTTALEMWQKGCFAVLITDCHMPGMDGYTLTQAIRATEAALARPRTPVIAWTANALAEERNKCRDAGMDELLVKPNDLAQLKKALASCLSLEGADSGIVSVSADGAGVDPRKSPIDLAVLSQVVPEGPGQLQVLKDFRRHVRADCAKLLQVLENGELVQGGSTAHRMKGACRMVGAEALAGICSAIERAAKLGDLKAAGMMREALTEEAGRLDIFLGETGRFREISEGGHGGGR